MSDQQDSIVSLNLGDDWLTTNTSKPALRSPSLKSPTPISHKLRFNCYFNVECISNRYDTDIALFDNCCSDLYYKNITYEDYLIGIKSYDVDLNQFNYYGHYLDTEYRIKMRYELKTRPVLSYDCYFGSHYFYSDDNNRILLLSSNKVMGSNISYKFTSYDVNVNLCPGNFVPAADSLNFELTVEYQNCFNSYTCSFGFSPNYDLKMKYNQDAICYFGLSILYNLSIGDQRKRLYFGVACSYELHTLSRFSRVYPFGINMSYEFYNPPYNLYFGSSVISTVKVEYEIEFLETGCFENEYLPVDPNTGLVIKDEIQIIPREEDFFRHQIKARCF